MTAYIARVERRPSDPDYHHGAQHPDENLAAAGIVGAGNPSEARAFVAERFGSLLSDTTNVHIELCRDVPLAKGRWCCDG